MTTFTVDIIRRPIDETMFADLGIAYAAFQSIPGDGVIITVDATLTKGAIVRARCRLRTPDAATEALLWGAYNGWKADATYLAIAEPTAAETAAQVKALTQQMRGVMEYLLPELT